ncbi:MAG TPA: ATP-binding protein [Kiritimatiellia bacterium]|nr:ATP-binding protein [Kiritimatiellia bacterium]
MPLRIVLAGPESTGKSRLAAHLAKRYRVPCAPEYARIYLEANGPEYDYALLRRLAGDHLVHQARCVPALAPLGILDTDLINYKIWCDVVFGRCHPEILEALARETNHAYLLCAPDVPWAPDPLRENPHDRPALFERHRREIERLGRPFGVVTGLGRARYRNAEAAFEKLAAASSGCGGPVRGGPRRT